MQGSGLSQPVDERIIRKIDALVNEGVKDTHEMRRHLNVYIKQQILSKDEIQPSPSNRRFFPKLSDIRSHMYRASIKNRFSKIDQENVADKIAQWQSTNPEDFFYFRPYGEATPKNTEGHSEEVASNSLLFVHQSRWQRRLLQRYGNDICLLDATYKTTRYALPLFFLVVPTNVDYQVVASFVIQNETSQCIREALQIIQKETAGWNPKCFMTDNCEQEITAIEGVFPGKQRESPAPMKDTKLQN